MRTKCSLKTTMKFWILVLAAAALLMWSLVRERLEMPPGATPPPRTTPPPPPDDTVDPTCPTGTELYVGGYGVPKCVAPGVAEFTCPTGYVRRAGGECLKHGTSNETIPPQCPSGKEYSTELNGCITPMVPATCPANYHLVAGQGNKCIRIGSESSSPSPSPSPASAASTAAAAGSGDWEEGPEPVCPGERILNEDDKCVGDEIVAYECPTGYERTEFNTCMRIGGTEVVDPICPENTAFNSEINVCEMAPIDPSCPGGYTLREKKCMRRRVAPSTTTGGSSTSMQGPTTGGAASRIRQVFGPQFTERGNEVPSNDGDSSQTNVYPELLGGKIDSSSRIPGAGITVPSKNWQLATNGSLPTSKSLGSDELARYFPFSRSPGDMDIIPDPYRVAQTFSASSYSSKTEPVPFLTDFSAFQR